MKKMVPKSIKDAVTAAYTEFVAQDGRAFQMVKGSGFINLAGQLFNSGKLLSSSPNIHIENILPDPTTVSNLVSNISNICQIDRDVFLFR